MNQRGFSLIEILLVIVIVGFIITLIANLPSSINLVTQGRQAALSKDIATKQIEDARSKTFANLANGTQNITDTRLSSLASGTGTITVADCPANICPNQQDPLFASIKQVTVNISWLNKGKTENLQVVTLISQGGLK